MRVRSGHRERSSLRERVRSKCCKHTVGVIRDGGWVANSLACAGLTGVTRLAHASEGKKTEGNDSRGIVAGSKLRERHSFLVKLAYLRKLR